MRTCDVCNADTKGHLSPSYYTSYPHILAFDLCKKCEGSVSRNVITALIKSGIPESLIPGLLLPDYVRFLSK